MLHVDIPTLPELQALVATRADACVSIYVATTPHTQHVGGSRIALANLAKEAVAQLDAAGFDKRRRALIEAEIAALHADDDFWRLQARSLAVLATPDTIRTYRLATNVQDVVEVADRFHVKPLLRAHAFPQHAFALLLSEGDVRLVEIFPDTPPVTVRVPDLPKDAGDATGRASVNNLGQNTRLSNAEGQTVLLRQYARKVDAALRPVLAGRDTPLILVATDPLAPIFRAVNSYPGLLPDGLQVSPDRMSDSVLADSSRAVLDRLYARQVADVRARYGDRSGQLRATADLASVSRAATQGAVDVLLVDMDHQVTGTVDDADGAIYPGKVDTTTYDIVDEIAGRALMTGARVLAVRRADIPDGAPAAAILRWAV